MLNRFVVAPGIVRALHHQPGHGLTFSQVLGYLDVNLGVSRPGTLNLFRNIFRYVPARCKKIRHCDYSIGPQLDAAIDTLVDIGLGKLEKSRYHRFVFAVFKFRDLLGKSAHLIIGGLFTTAVCD
jgi:hypothetical protein